MPSVQKQSQQSAAAAAEGTVVVGVVMLAVIGVVIGGRRHSRRSRGGGDTTIKYEGAVRDAGTCCGDGAEVAHAATTGRAAAVASPKTPSYRLSLLTELWRSTHLLISFSFPSPVRRHSKTTRVTLDAHRQQQQQQQQQQPATNK